MKVVVNPFLCVFLKKDPIGTLSEDRKLVGKKKSPRTIIGAATGSVKPNKFRRAHINSGKGVYSCVDKITTNSHDVRHKSQLISTTPNKYSSL
jgi:hypothetical protein